MNGRATYLDRIVDHHRARAAEDPRRPVDLRARVADAEPRRGFEERLRTDSTGGLCVIAEIKRRSPSKGDLRADLDPEVLARLYADGGASCLSVLTDEAHFGGSADDLRSARNATDLPVLRKDFTVDVRDVYDASLMGADCVLLIAAALDPGELADLHGVAREIGIDALVEVHDEDELAVALGVGASLVGVNQRDLFTFDVDHDRAERMGVSIPSGVVAVAESGVRGPQDAIRLAGAGYHAVLVGESLVTSADPRSAVAALRGA